MLNRVKLGLGRYRSLIVRIFLAAALAGIVLFAAGAPVEQRLLALDAATGRVHWSVVLADQPDALGVPVVSNGRVFISVVTESSPGSLYSPHVWKLVALDAGSGNKLWEFVPDERQFGPLAVTMTRRFIPVADADNVYVSIIGDREEAWLATLDAKTGALRWTVAGLWFTRADFNAFADLLISPARYPGVYASGDSVYAILTDEAGTSRGSVLAALDAHTGNPRWHAAIDLKPDTPHGTTPYLTANEQAVFVMTGKQMVSLDPRTGAVSSELSGISSDAVVWVIGSTLYVNMGKSITATDSETGKQRWAYSVPDKVGACGLLNGDSASIYAFCFGKENDKVEPSQWSNLIVALDARDGAERWRKPAAENLFMTLTQMPAVEPDAVIFVGGRLSSPEVAALSADTGSLRWRLPVHDALEVVSADDAHVFVVDKAARGRHWLAYLDPAWH